MAAEAKEMKSLTMKHPILHMSIGSTIQYRFIPIMGPTALPITIPVPEKTYIIDIGNESVSSFYNTIGNGETLEQQTAWRELLDKHARIWLKIRMGEYTHIMIKSSREYVIYEAKYKDILDRDIIPPTITRFIAKMDPNYLPKNGPPMNDSTLMIKIGQESVSQFYKTAGDGSTIDQRQIWKQLINQAKKQQPDLLNKLNNDSYTKLIISSVRGYVIYSIERQNKKTGGKRSKQTKRRSRKRASHKSRK